MRCYFEVMRGPPLLHTKGDDSDAGEQTCSGAASVGAGVCVCGAAAEHLERSGVIEPARWAKSLNSRRQERVELNGRRGRVEEYIVRGGEVQWTRAQCVLRDLVKFTGPKRAFRGTPRRGI